jgi:hypothetical protein
VDPVSGVADRDLQHRPLLGWSLIGPLNGTIAALFAATQPGGYIGY